MPMPKNSHEIIAKRLERSTHFFEGSFTMSAAIAYANGMVRPA